MVGEEGTLEWRSVGNKSLTNSIYISHLYLIFIWLLITVLSLSKALAGIECCWQSVYFLSPRSNNYSHPCTSKSCFLADSTSNRKTWHLHSCLCTFIIVLFSLCQKQNIHWCVNQKKKSIMFAYTVSNWQCFQCSPTRITTHHKPLSMLNMLTL